ncbi:uncharacterized protein LOC124682710 isoform X2 [Lolium rigidum]|uniref:uncharacterized protein LOC124682710 isoform X2 n=1 Tax=Lolium rigidum TaxID=89674 RepID=UPI001F5D6C55|nr:uncharacterized protein LOC124682710 isoform X2 [Lolium rigidum]
MLLAKGSLDLVLVPCGMVIMFGYHLILLYRILRRPGTTVIGYENHNKLAWVRRMTQATPEETALALSVISSSIAASTNLASLSIALGSLIGAWVSSTSKVFMTELVYGDNSQATAAVKYISLLVCFLVSFTCFIHSARRFQVLCPGQLPGNHAGLRHSSELHAACGDPRRQLLVHGTPSTLLRDDSAHVDLRANTNVCLLGVHGVHPAHAGQELPATAPAPVYSQETA